MTSSPTCSSSYNNSNNESTAKMEWPNTTSIRVATKDDSQNVRTAPTAKKPKKVDLARISPDDLTYIKAQDPFLYYSIPGVRSAGFLLEDIDMSNLEMSRMARDCASQESVQGKAQSQKMTRRSCISFECHPQLLLEDLLDDDTADFDCDSFDEDEFLDFYAAAFNTKQ